ncbi:patatin-like phospholipase family protein [Mycolicibacterium komossense]|uniref:Patatin-like phospholipase family protein n=1 Tax=Mycolicibacterium komossense TaxID=1779 RepID=A0ABT3C6U9_9MYCO|nr:patatin-like phospholipase family protein [Mycolicibacterium komossense]MCV7225188.1 patatin-like phospholipase family protein [Mycolicibacterium komossense]
MALAAERADLVLSGGGVKGIGLVGAVAALLDAGYAPQRISGTSAGALVGAVLAGAVQSGEVTGARLKELTFEIDYRTFLDQGLVERVPVLGPAWGVLSGSGVYRGDALRKWIDTALARFGVSTFADLAISDKALPVEQRYRLVVTVADVTLGQLVRLPWDYQRVYGLDPDEQSVADAVRASTAIPFFYQPAKLTSADGRTSTLVDGGLLSNFPIDSLDRTDGKKPRWPTFGVTLMPNLPEGNDQLIPALRPLHLLGGPTLLEQVVTTMLVGRDQAYLSQPWVQARTIRVNTADVGVLDFDLSERDKEALYDDGLRAGREFLRTWNFANYLTRFR